MRDEHVISMIENAPLSSLSESERALIHAHTERCEECRRAFEAAQVSTLLLRERVAAETIEPSPFFQTRVLAALRERQAAGDTSALRRLWNATGALVSSMAATVAALVILTVFAPGSQPTQGPLEVASSDSSYSAEEVLFDRDDVTAEQMSYGQVLSTLYESDDDR
jgi:anti-sigma-K factor RskA